MEEYLEKLKDKLTENGTLKDAALKMGVNATYVTEIFSRNKPISTQLAVKLTEHFGVDGLQLLKYQTEAKYRKFGGKTEDAENVSE